MLNPDLNLNNNIFKEDVEKKATREGYGEGLLELGTENENVVVLTADLAESTKVDKFAEKYPNRFIECGVAEQNMVAIAAGLGVSGKIPYASSYATFSPGKNWETFRTTAVYNFSNVKLAGHHSGLMTGPDGATHQATEDIAITRCLPILKVFSPTDFIEAKRITKKVSEFYGPVYIRLTREKTPIILTENTPQANIGSNQTFWVSDNPKATIFATGYMVYYALLAATKLKDNGVNVYVVNVSSIKPTDTKDIIEKAKETGAIVSVEDHQVNGGLGSMLSEVLAKERPTPIEMIGMQDTFGESGNIKDLLIKYKMDTDSIVSAVKKVINRK